MSQVVAELKADEVSKEFISLVETSMVQANAASLIQRVDSDDEDY
jgi:hypothetical protein